MFVGLRTDASEPLRPLALGVFLCGVVLVSGISSSAGVLGTSALPPLLKFDEEAKLALLEGRPGCIVVSASSVSITASPRCAMEEEGRRADDKWMLVWSVPGGHIP
jgi:hypothetical protein